MKNGEEITLNIEQFAFEGKCVARVEGRVVFVPRVVPGDVVRVRIRKVKTQFAEAEPIEIIQFSSLRTDPPCKDFGVCGGCKWQQVNSSSQLLFKRQHVVDALERIGGFQNIPVNETLGSEEIYFYRNKMEFSFGEQWLADKEFAEIKAAGGTGGPALGLHPAARFDKVLDIHECWLQSLVSNRILNTVRRLTRECAHTIYSTRTHQGYLRNLMIREGRRTGDLMVNLVTSEDREEVMAPLSERLLEAIPEITTLVNNVTRQKSQVAIGEYERVYYGPGTITEQLGGLSFRISANSFFQPNTVQAERLYNVVKRMAQLEKEDVVYDLYSGTGTIALFLADQVSNVIGIEVIESAVLDARRNAALNGVTHCEFEMGDLKEKLTKDCERLQRHPPPTVIIIDPPRSGVHPKAIAAILKLRPRRLIYVSCNPTTQARDLKLLCAEGDYIIEEVQPVDMFPHTYHIENVVGLKRSEPHL